MKVGDLVNRSSMMLRMHDKDGNQIQIPQKQHKEVGTVIAVRDLHRKHSNEYFAKLVGSAVDVLWASGRLQENYASNALKVITDG
jgi:hypothetical protein